MIRKCSWRRRSIAIALVAVALTRSATIASAQAPALDSRDSVTLPAGPGYAAGPRHRSLLGDNYRAEWTTPIRVPVLDLRTFAGGLTATKLGGGRQTRSLRFVAPDSAEYVFRPVFKSNTILPDEYRGTLIWSLFRDQGSASHPGGVVAAAPILRAVGLLHPTPRLVVMPDDPRLGEFRSEFAGLLGSIEEYPTVPGNGRAFAGASEILDAQGLLDRINADPVNVIDARTFLRARLVDMLLNDNDRHPDQWKWARLSEGGAWEPIPRDRDKVFLSYEGKLLDIARKIAPALVRFDSTYPKGSALFENAMEFDRRLLAGLDRTAWKSEATRLQQTITDAVIDESIRAIPREYAPHSARIAAKLRARRDHLPDAALEYYGDLWTIAELHGTDAPEEAVVTRGIDGSVSVALRSRGAEPYLARRFDPAETREIRLYLHGGDDHAVVSGEAQRSITVRVVGGNGTNTLDDRSLVNGHRNPTHLYDAGTVTGVRYDPDTVHEHTDPASALDRKFNRRPWVRAYTTELPPQRDRGVSMKPVIGARTGHGIGLVPRIGIARTVYGFRHVPYQSKLQGDLAYSFVHRGGAVNLLGDKRFESSAAHVLGTAAVTQLEIVQFRGFGNDIPEREEEFYDVKQTAWHFRPAIGFSLNEASDISVGPILRYTTTASEPNQFISQLRPYGFTSFAEAGLQLKLHHDTRSLPDTMKPRLVFDAGATGYPGMLDVKSAYESVEGAATAYLNIPFGPRPVVALRAGGKKVYGSFPYFDAAFIGGGSTLRTEHRQRFSGDASVYGAGELRVPVAKFPLVVPLDVGLIGFSEAGRVYLDGESPGGWHTAVGAGFWIGVVDPGKNINVLFTSKPERRTMVSLGFAY
ncbi:MAG TPA: hypothetical protein VHM24_03975 [Gemmatimonadaceae bacterium]|nr:hypothetical protein [Gemmatimonadaceae bacterium]